jgi:CheY-like chemotaxis protein
MANVLIVDDDSDTVEISTALLESSGHRVRTGYNGEEGLKSLGEGKLPDCVLLDVDMPVLSGPGMVHQMLLHDAGEEKIPIVLVSARSDLPEVARRIGTRYFLAKASPDYGDNLLRILGRALRERRAPDPPLDLRREEPGPERDIDALMRLAERNAPATGTAKPWS